MISDPKHGWCNFKLGDFETITNIKEIERKVD